MIDIVRNKNLEEFGKKLGYSKIYNIKDFKVSTNFEDFRRKGLDFIYGLEVISQKDTFHQRASGLNQVYCKLAVRNKIAVAFNLRDIFYAKDKYVVLGRVMQNIRLCRKYKVKMMIISLAEDEYGMRNPMDLISLGISLGMTAKEASDGLNWNK